MMIEGGDLAYLTDQIYSCGTASDFRSSFTGHRLRQNKGCFTFPSGGAGNLNHIGIWLLRYTDYNIHQNTCYLRN
jgi:hypothetical protein